MKIVKTIFMILTAVWLFMASDTAFAEKADITWTGCGITRKAFMAECAQAYKKSTGKIIALSGGGAKKGIRDAAAGKTDIGGSCRPCLPDFYPKWESSVIMTHVAWDALVVMVHPANPVTSLTSDEVTKIFKGDIRSWKKVGGENTPVIVVTRRGKINGVGYLARKMLFNDRHANFSRFSINLKSSVPVEKKVERVENAIGISGVSSARKRKVRLLALDGVDPTKENVANGTYPLFRPLFLMTRGEPAGDVKDFLDWIVSDEGQKVISDQGTVNLEEGRGLVKKFRYWEHTNLIRNYK